MAAASAVLNAGITIPGERVSRVALTPTAVELLQKMWGVHGPLMFHQSGGCCDGSSPMCYPAGEFITAEADIMLGLFQLPDCGPLEFWMSKEQFNYWSHTHLTVDVVNGRGSGFSVEAPEGKWFLIRSRLVEGFDRAAR